MSDSNQTVHYLAIEATSFGEDREEDKTFYKLGLTSNTLVKTRSSDISAEIRDDRNVADHRLGLTEVSGDLGFELAYDPSSGLGALTKSAMRNVTFESVAALTSSNLSCVASDNSINLSSGTFPVVEAGDTITISGVLGATANNGKATVVSRTATKIIVSGKTLIDDAAGDSVTITPNVQILKPSTRPNGPLGLALDEQYLDVNSDAHFHYFKGLAVNTMAVSIPNKGICSVTFSMMGQDMEVYASQASTPSYTASLAGRPCDGYSGSVTIDGTENGVITQLDFSLNNNMATKPVIGSPLTNNFTIGQVSITGTMTAYFGDDSIDLFNAFLDETAVAIKKIVIDPDGNKITYKFPKCFYTGASAPTNGVSGEITTSLPFQAVYDSTAGCAFEIRFNPKLT